jgi:predicted component of type VI protein secretion system
MTIDIASLLQPISTDNQSGSDCRNSDSFQAIAAEMELLTNVTASRQVDWGKVEEIAQLILTKESKDFLVAAWFSAAQIEKYGIAID